MQRIKRHFRLPSTLERDLEDELTFHIEMRIADNLAGGMTLDEATADSLRRFGNVEAVRQACREVDNRAIIHTARVVILFLVFAGVTVWTVGSIAQLKVLGQTILITGVLLQLFTYVRISTSTKSVTVPGIQSDDSLVTSQKTTLIRKSPSPKRKIESILILALLILPLLMVLLSMRAISARRQQHESKPIVRVAS